MWKWNNPQNGEKTLWRASFGDLKIENSIEKVLVLDLGTQEWWREG
jgi:hypothetical protein